MEESKGGTDHLAAVCSPWPVSRLKPGVYHSHADKNQMVLIVQRDTHMEKHACHFDEMLTCRKYKHGHFL